MGWRAQRVAFSDVLAVQEALDCPEPLAWTLVRRGLADPDAAREFMRSDGPLDPAEALDGITAAADRITAAVARGETIAVHGDYDCDGVCSTAVLTRALKGSGASVVPFLPSRFTDGYGVRVETVERLAAEGANLLVCVDCGTSAGDALTRAHELGMDTIVCDHHLAGGERPPGIIANPALGRPADDLPAAVGVVFMLVRALAARRGADLLGMAPEDELDLVALATVADAVPLVGQNRRLVTRGLEVMRKAPRPGIRALCRAAGIDPRTLTARDLGFQLGPTINAAGRLRHASEALELVLAADEAAAAPIAERLWALNMERRDLEQRITAEAIAQVEASPDEIRDAPAIVAFGDDWHEGVVGIVASRLVDRFERPAIVISRDGDVAKGSGRSLAGLDLHDLVSRAEGSLTRWGGHSGAVGLQLPAADIARFQHELIAAARELSGAIERARVRPVDAVVGARELSIETAEAFEALAPFGRGNPSARLLLPGAIAERPGTVGAGGRHLTLRLRCGGAHSRAIGFRHGHRAATITAGDRFDAHVSLGIERFQGFVGPRVVIERLEPLEGASWTAAQVVAAGPAPLRGIADVRDHALGLRAVPAPPGPPDLPPAVIRDHRDEGAAMSRIVALAGADAGVTVLCSAVGRRAAVLNDLLAPQRLGLEGAVVGGVQSAIEPLRERLAGTADRPSLVLLDYAVLRYVAIPAGAHVVMLDPPGDESDLDWAMFRAAGEALHLCWSEPEVEFARSVCAARWDLREVAARFWAGISDLGTASWDGALEARLLGAEPGTSSVEAVGDALVALAEIGLISLDESGLTVVADAPRRAIGDAGRAVEAAARMASSLAFLARASTLDVSMQPVRVPVSTPGDDIVGR